MSCNKCKSQQDLLFHQTEIASEKMASLYFFFPSNTWPCLIAAANYRQGTINRLAFFLTQKERIVFKASMHRCKLFGGMLSWGLIQMTIGWMTKFHRWPRWRIIAVLPTWEGKNISGRTSRNLMALADCIARFVDDYITKMFQAHVAASCQVLSWAPPGEVDRARLHWLHLQCPLAEEKLGLITLPDTNSSHLKMDGWNTTVSFWGPAYFQGRKC